MRFTGEQLADFRATAGRGDQRPASHGRSNSIGGSLASIFSRLTIKRRMAEQASETTLRGLQAMDVNLQRGFVTVQAGGRLQVRSMPRRRACSRPSGKASPASCSRTWRPLRPISPFAWSIPLFNWR